MSGGRGGYAFALAISTALLAASAPPARAGGVCASQASYSYSYAAPAVSYSYAAPAYQTVYKTVYPQAVKVYASPDFYSSSQDYYRDKVLVDAMAGKTAEALQLQQRLQGLESQLQQSQQLLQQQRLQTDQEYQEYQRWKYERQQPPPQQQYAPPQQQPAYPPAYPPEQPRAPQPGYPPPQQQQPPAPHMPPAYGNGNSYHPQTPRQSQGGGVPAGLDQVVASSCIRCHGGGSGHQGGGLDLRDLASVPWETRLLCHSEVCNGTMPRGGQALTPEQTAMFYEWAQAGRMTARR